MLQTLANDLPIKSLTGHFAVFRQDKLDGCLRHQRCGGHPPKSILFLFPVPFLKLVQLEHLVDEDLVSLLTFKLIKRNAISNILGQLSTL